MFALCFRAREVFHHSGATTKANLPLDVHHPLYLQQLNAQKHSTKIRLPLRETFDASTLTKVYYKGCMYLVANVNFMQPFSFNINWAIKKKTQVETC